MAAFEYGNTRLRVMKAQLFSPPQLGELIGMANVESLLNALAKSPYRAAVAAAALQYRDLPALHQVLRLDLLGTAAKIDTFFSDREAELAALVLRRYDVHNVKTVLRGLAHRLPPEDILEATLPLADLRSAELAALARCEDVRAAVDLLATWRFPAASVLRQRATSPVAMELALEQWYVETVLAAPVAQATVLPEAIKLEADVSNILTVLRLSLIAGKKPGEVEALLGQLFGTADFAAQLIGPGLVPFSLLVEAAGQPGPTQAVATLADTPYGVVLQAVLPVYQNTERVSEFERRLACLKLDKARGLMIRDPLGIGVLWGYLALKTAEITNLRLIGAGLALHDPPQHIQSRLISAGTS